MWDKCFVFIQYYQNIYVHKKIQHFCDVLIPYYTTEILRFHYHTFNMLPCVILSSKDYPKNYKGCIFETFKQTKTLHVIDEKLSLITRVLWLQYPHIV